MAKIGIAVFPGSNCDRDVHHVLNNVVGVQALLDLPGRTGAPDAEGADAELDPAFFRLDPAVERFHEHIDILPSPVRTA